jgi:membrane protein
MSWLMNVPPIARARRALGARSRAIWNLDRSQLRGFRAFRVRAFRIVILAVRGIYAHRLGLQGAALTYYTIFAIVPMLVVALWILKSFDVLPAISPRLPANVLVPTGNQMLQAALGMILQAVDRTSELVSGVVGLAVLLFAVSKMFGYTERALHIIAGSGERTPKFSRVLAYVALLLIPPVALAVSGVSLFLMRGSRATRVGRLLTAIPGLEMTLGFVFAFGALWLAVTLLYAAAVRARIPFRSAALGGVVSALALVVISWVFANLQIGVTHANAVSSGFLAFPVFLVWAKSSWYAVLVGAEIAVAHRTDSVLARGAATFRLDCAGERKAGVAIMLHLTRAVSGAPGAAVTEDELARDLRLPPSIVRGLCFRFVRRGLLGENVRGFYLRDGAEAMTNEAIADAIDRDPALEGAEPQAPAGG